MDAKITLKEGINMKKIQIEVKGLGMEPWRK